MAKKLDKKRKYSRYKPMNFDSYSIEDFYAARFIYKGEKLKEFKKSLKKALKKTGRTEYYLSFAISMKKSVTKALPYIKDAVEVMGTTEVAKKVGVNRVSLYHMLSNHGNPSLSNIEKILKVMGLKLTVDQIYDEYYRPEDDDNDDLP